MIPLQYQVSSQGFWVGPFISTDGDTESTGLTINNTDVYLYKHGSAVSTTKSTSGLTSSEAGMYYGKLSSDDTDTYGSLIMKVHVSSALYVKEYFRVMNANEYAAVTSTDYMDINVNSMSSGAISSQTMSSGAISTITISTAMTDVMAHSVWAESTKTLTAFSTNLWSTAFHSTAFVSTAYFSTAFWSTAFYSTAISDNVSTAVWNYGTKELTGFSTGFKSGYLLSTTEHDNISDVTWDNSTRILTGFSTDLWSTAFFSTAFFSTAFWSTAFYSTSISDNISTAVWDYATKTLTAFSTDLWSTAFVSTEFFSTAFFSTAFWSTAFYSTSITDNVSIGVWDYGTRSVTDKTGYSLSTAGTDSVFDVLVESTITVQNALMLLLAEAVGASTGGGTSTAVFYSPNSTTARITATTSSLGNRSSMTFDLT